LDLTVRVAFFLVPQIMEMIKNYYGQRENSAWELWVQCIHTGSASEFLVALANDTSSCAAAILMKGASWEIKSIMEASAVIAGEVFQERNFRERRSILMDICKASYKVLNELNRKNIWDDGTDHLRVRIEFDPYQPLLDVDWIEDIMELVKELTIGFINRFPLIFLTDMCIDHGRIDIFVT
jgi:hypothetical protein